MSIRIMYRSLPVLAELALLRMFSTNCYTLRSSSRVTPIHYPCRCTLGQTTTRCCLPPPGRDFLVTMACNKPLIPPHIFRPPFASSSSFPVPLGQREFAMRLSLVRTNIRSVNAPRLERSQVAISSKMTITFQRQPCLHLSHITLWRDFLMLRRQYVYP